MSDQFENKIDDAKGRAKEAAGAVTGDDELKHEGKADQIKASVKDKVDTVAEKVKEKFD
ncbi:CsbD family protein [Nocardioides daejeonensis]|uniref:CsbD family protein n=1 Tax=Nocardioides daejeonensis TaxID=1046556 RepID=UPI001951FA5C|nr:CsbD family protein [Nocardioides daejeonensis]